MKALCITKSPKVILIAGIGLLALLFATPSPAPLVNIVSSATADLTTHVLTLYASTGNSFPTNKGAPTVTLGNILLPQSTDYNAMHIVATLPPSVDPGFYTALVTYGSGNNSSTYSIDITISEPTTGGEGGVPHRMREFRASDTWPVPPDVTRLLVEVWGAGGGPGASGGPLSFVEVVWAERGHTREQYLASHRKTSCQLRLGMAVALAQLVNLALWPLDLQ